MAIQYSIHKAAEEDLPSLLRLNHELFEYEYAQGFSSTYDRKWTYSDAGTKYFRDIIESEDKNAWIVFNEQKIQAGFLIAVVHDLPYRDPSRVAEIEMVYIDEDYRCSGIGRDLVEHFKSWASEKGAGILRVGALAGNKHAREFYEKWGFTEAEIMYEITVQKNS